jgi:hypothetical protein
MATDPAAAQGKKYGKLWKKAILPILSGQRFAGFERSPPIIGLYQVKERLSPTLAVNLPSCDAKTPYERYVGKPLCDITLVRNFCNDRFRHADISIEGPLSTSTDNEAPILC